MRNIEEPSLEDIMRHGGGGQQRQGGGINDLLANHDRQRSRPLTDNPRIASIILNTLFFGEDDILSQLLQEEVAKEELISHLIEWPFRRPDPDMIQGPINIGHCMETGAPVGIFPHEVHTLIVGASGKGKSTLNRHLIRQHLDARIPVLIIDLEKEYAETLNDDRINVLGIRNSDRNFKWNPLEVPPGMDAILYRQMLVAVFADICGLLIASKNFLSNAIHRLYELYGVYDGSETYPSMYDLMDYLNAMLNDKKSKSNTRTYQYSEVSYNRVEGFINTIPGVLDCSSGMSLDILTTGNLILEVHGLDPDYLAVLICLLLTWISCHRIANGMRNNPQNDLAVFVDEAQLLWDVQQEKRLYQSSSSVLSRLTATVRKYNLKLFVAAQQPSLLASSIKANSFCKVQFALGDGGDIMDMGSSMFLTQEQIYYSRLLEVGQAIVKFAGRWPEPFVLDISDG